MSYDSSHLTTSDIKWLGVSDYHFKFKPGIVILVQIFKKRRDPHISPQVRPSDLDRYNLPAQCRLQLTEHDRKMGEELLQEAFVQRHPEWVKELQIMLKSGEKAEIQVINVGILFHPDSHSFPNLFSFVPQALSSFGFQFITEQFLPRKLLEGDWI